MDIKNYIGKYLKETEEMIRLIDTLSIAKMIEVLERIKNNKGRLFILGVGGSAANASHAVNDFRKIVGIESYTPVDNVAELTAWTNDLGFEFIFVKWLEISKLNKNDCVMVLSVGGGTDTTSKNLVLAMDYAKEAGAPIVSIVSRDGGKAIKVSDACILIPTVAKKRITPHAEAWQGLLLHLIVNALSA